MRRAAVCYLERGEIYVDIPQTYSAQPGTPLGKFTIRRILKTDGTKQLKKWQTV